MTRTHVEQIVKGVLRSVSASLPVLISISQAWAELDSAGQERRLHQLEEDLAHLKQQATPSTDYTDPFQRYGKETAFSAE